MTGNTQQAAFYWCYSPSRRTGLIVLGILSVCSQVFVCIEGVLVNIIVYKVHKPAINFLKLNADLNRAKIEQSKLRSAEPKENQEKSGYLNN